MDETEETLQYLITALLSIFITAGKQSDMHSFCAELSKPWFSPSPEWQPQDVICSIADVLTAKLLDMSVEESDKIIIAMKCMQVVGQPLMRLTEDQLKTMKSLVVAVLFFCNFCCLLVSPHSVVLIGRDQMPTWQYLLVVMVA
jgi:hypothetical protein